MINRIPFANYHVFTYTLRSVATNSGLRGGRGGRGGVGGGGGVVGGRAPGSIGTFLYRKDGIGIKEPNVSSMFLLRINNIEYNIKQNIYTGMEIMSLMPR